MPPLLIWRKRYNCVDLASGMTEEVDTASVTLGIGDRKWKGVVVVAERSKLNGRGLLLEVYCRCATRMMMTGSWFLCFERRVCVKKLDL